MKSVESCRKLFSCKELAGHTSAGTGFPKITERQAKACRHRPTPLNCEGPNGVFRIVEVIRYSVALRNSARNRFPLTITPEPLTLGQGSQDASLTQGLTYLCK